MRSIKTEERVLINHAFILTWYRQKEERKAAMILGLN